MASMMKCFARCVIFIGQEWFKNLSDLRIPEIKNDPKSSKNVKSSDITTGSEACFGTCFDPLDHLGSLGCAQLRPCASSSPECLADSFDGWTPSSHRKRMV